MIKNKETNKELNDETNKERNSIHILKSNRSKFTGFRKTSITMLVGMFLLIGCGKTTQEEVKDEPVPVSDAENPEETNPKISEDVAKAMEFDKQIDAIASITLKDLEGNVVERIFSEEEVASIQQAFNDSYIMDTAYIEMIGGNTMTIELEDGRSVFIHSYGDENFIVARISDEETYHLGCELIGKILLETNK